MSGASVGVSLSVWVIAMRKTAPLCVVFVRAVYAVAHVKTWRVQL